MSAEREKCSSRARQVKGRERGAGCCYGITRIIHAGISIAIGEGAQECWVHNAEAIILVQKSLLIRKPSLQVMHALHV